MIPNNIKEKIVDMLSVYHNNKITKLDYKHLSGGCINNSIVINTNFGRYFVKWNTDTEKSFFSNELKGLKLISETNTISIPSIIGCDDEFLMLDFIDPEDRDIVFWHNFGRNLSQLHRCSSTSFGLEYDNYIGTLPQYNQRELKWSDFFISNRLIPQIRMGAFPSNFVKSFDQFFIKIETLFPEENPSLLHGDLWSGNFLISNSSPILIDPAVYYGFREMDLAMTRLFGGFDDAFYDAYHENFPLNKGWEERVKICNLYTLLVHANLFGNSYYYQIKDILNRFN